MPPAGERCRKLVGGALTNSEKHIQVSPLLGHMSRQDGQVFLNMANDGAGLPAGLCQLTDDGHTWWTVAGHYGLTGI